MADGDEFVPDFDLFAVPDLTEEEIAATIEAYETARPKIQVLLELADEEKPSAYVADNYAVSEGYFVVESDGVLVFFPTDRIKQVYVRPLKEEQNEEASSTS